MTLDEIIQKIIEVEDLICKACQEDEFDKAQEYTQQRINLIEQLKTLSLNEDEKQKLSQFATELQAHISNQIHEFEETQEQTRLELVKYKQGSNGLQLYRQIRRGK